MVSFEWDENKNKDNQKKHHISFEVVQEAFLILNVLFLKMKNIVVQRSVSLYRQSRRKNYHSTLYDTRK